MRISLTKKISFFFTFLVFSSASFATVSKIEIFPPYSGVGCEDLGTDNVFSLGLHLEKLSVSETDSQIQLTSNNTLNLCVKKSDGTLSWEKVNPFAGFDVPFYDIALGIISLRRDYIDTNSKANRFEFGIFLEKNQSAFKALMREGVNTTIEGSIKINKLELLEQQDIDQLNRGISIRKVIELFYVSNMTSLVHGETLQFGDEPWSERQVAITFVKENNSFKIKNVTF